MPVNKPTLQASKQCFTMQDYYDGKCTKEGSSLDKVGAMSFKEDEAAKNAPPEQEATTAVNPDPVADETQPTEAVQPEAPIEDNVDGSGQPNPPEAEVELPKEGE